MKYIKRIWLTLVTVVTSFLWLPLYATYTIGRDIWNGELDEQLWWKIF